MCKYAFDAGEIGKVPVVLAKSQAYMNYSGESVSKNLPFSIVFVYTIIQLQAWRLSFCVFFFNRLGRSLDTIKYIGVEYFWLSSILFVSSQHTLNDYIIVFFI